MNALLPGFVHLQGHLLAAVDVETTGTQPGFHEIIQIAIQPLDSKIEPLKNVMPFYVHIKPEYPERLESRAQYTHKIDIDWLLIHGIDKWKTAEMLDDWHKKLDLPYNKSLAPLAQNWQFEASFLKAWLGLEHFDHFFVAAQARDTMIIARYINDKAYRKGQTVPFNRVSLESLCKRYGIENENPHDALGDARAEAAVYRQLVMEDI